MTLVVHADIIATYLASIDARDKMLKGAGCFFTFLGVVTANTKYISMGTLMSQARSLMRLLSWLSNARKISDALEKNIVQPRDVIYILRVLLDGVFCFLDNIVYVCRFFHQKNAQLVQLSVVSRASLFWGYVFAVLLDIYDLTHDKAMPNRTGRYLVLVRNTCDMISSVRNVCSLHIGAANVALLGLISAVIASREQYSDAFKSRMGRRLAAGGFSK